jgi:hypothetical protein
MEVPILSIGVGLKDEQTLRSSDKKKEAFLMGHGRRDWQNMVCRQSVRRTRGLVPDNALENP